MTAEGGATEHQGHASKPTLLFFSLEFFRLVPDTGSWLNILAEKGVKSVAIIITMADLFGIEYSVMPRIELRRRGIKYRWDEELSA